MLDLAPYIESSGFDTAQFYPRLYNNNIVDGKVVGLPWFTDAGLLYYRTDLLEKYSLEVPTTWDELTEAATTIQAGEREGGNRILRLRLSGQCVRRSDLRCPRMAVQQWRRLDR
jgi:trehalose/maltose transport system substrate-binding protein